MISDYWIDIVAWHDNGHARHIKRANFNAISDLIANGAMVDFYVYDNTVCADVATHDWWQDFKPALTFTKDALDLLPSFYVQMMVGAAQTCGTLIFIDP